MAVGRGLGFADGDGSDSDVVPVGAGVRGFATGAGSASRAAAVFDVAEVAGDEFAAAGGVELAVQAFDVIVHGVRAAVERVGDVADGPPEGELLEDLLFAFGDAVVGGGDLAAEGEGGSVAEDGHDRRGDHGFDAGEDGLIALDAVLDGEDA